MKNMFVLPNCKIELPYFHHAHNCGLGSERHTERTVELAIADYWLSKVQDPVWEVGAVSPYYWSKRVARVTDIHDPHPEVSDRETLRAFDFTDKAVLSISTLEHVGVDAYYMGPDPEIQALLKLEKEAKYLLVTVPFGFSDVIDKNIFYWPLTFTDTRISYMVREKDETWRPAKQSEAQRPYTQWANSIAILEKGDILCSPTL